MTEQRRRIDPEGRYGGDGLTTVEQKALRIVELLDVKDVHRTRDAFEMHVGGEEGVVLLVTAEAMEVRLPTVEWTMGSHAPAATSRLWKQKNWRSLEADEAITALVAAGLAKRRSEFAACGFCGQSIPVEHRRGNACHSCAERHLGIVH